MCSFTKLAPYFALEGFSQLFFIPVEVLGRLDRRKVVAVHDCAGAALWAVDAAEVGKALAESHLNTLEKEAKLRGLHTTKTIDAGHTQIPKGSFTVLAIGPAFDEEVDEITGELALL